MPLVLNTEKNKPEASHLEFSKLQIFLGTDKSKRAAIADKIVNSLVAFARDTLHVELVGVMAQVNARVSDYDAYRAAGLTHEQANEQLAEKQALLKQIAEKNKLINVGKDILRGNAA